ncbi:GNAT family N-acetyltransferase [Rhizobium calliandrae]|uniref:GNAT family N-acetyltransferase n=1 Tax=Rhizobium calliandrae TaxID=1312182 RepID=A0ABT7KAX9_9HYPH|nr:GNAT family N-acetyltransferase [Rhizobium calliandrae]MDL2405778.1 GNAT family N-acetyltransferase [Rhizobium calliandrae]
MDTKIPEKLHVDAFEMRFADIADVDLSQLQALSMSVGWPHRSQDWQHLRDVGRGFVALDEIGRVSGSTMWFPHGETFATFGMLITAPRLQTNGTAKWLVKRMLAECHHERFRLNATRAARRMCAALGFTPQQTVFQCQGEVVSVPQVGPLKRGLQLRRLERGDLDAIVALDEPAFGTSRYRHLLRLFESSVCYGLYDGHRLMAYSMRRRFGRGYVVGPVVAYYEEDAIAVIQPHVVAHIGSFLRLDTHFDTGPFANFVQQSGMSIFDTVTTMVSCEAAAYGSPSNGSPIVFALASQSFG